MTEATPQDATDPRRLQAVLGPGYEVRGKLGEGTFGVVHEVYDRSLNRLLAAKVLRNATADLLGRFGLEAQILATLRHQNIVPVYFVGMQQGVAFMMMPKLMGIPLRRRMGAMTPFKECVKIVTQVAAALDVAHDANVVHRDIKPENIFVERAWRVSVMDFGIAKVVQPHGPLRTSSTVIGTPEYMSPEQINGDPAIDRRADVYSLATVAFELTCGRLPYERGRGQMRSLLMAQVNEPAPPLRPLRADVPAAYEAAVLRALSKQPAARFPTAGAFAAALKASVRESSPRRG